MWINLECENLKVSTSVRKSILKGKGLSLFQQDRGSAVHSLGWKIFTLKGQSHEIL